MSEHIEWVGAGRKIESTAEPGEWSDGFGNTNTGTAIAFGGTVVEGSIEELKDFALRVTQAVNDLEAALFTDAPEEEPLRTNEVRLVGRVSQAPEQRTLPSGAEAWTFRIVVHRDPGAATARQMVDAIECSAWPGRAARSVRAFVADDVVEVIGSLHRRFSRAGGMVSSRLEVEVDRARVLRRAPA